MKLFVEFFLILAGGAIGSLIGGIGGAVIGDQCPEIIRAAWRPYPITNTLGVGLVMGAFNGLLLGLASMGVARFIAAVRYGLSHWHRKTVDDSDEG